MPISVDRIHPYNSNRLAFPIRSEKDGEDKANNCPETKPQLERDINPNREYDVRAAYEAELARVEEIKEAETAKCLNVIA